MAGALAPSTRIGDFVIEGLLGSGGMGEVYRAIQVRLGRPVALKVLTGALSTDPVFAQRFLREATIMRDLEHPSVVTVYDAGADAGLLYLAMRLLESRTLRDVLADGPVRPERAIALLGPLADALDHAHRHGVVHRDIKPANILLDAAGRPYLADFGIAKAADGAPVTRVGQTLGTPRYMAPEQASGAVGPRTDQYSLACVAFEMLTGTAPFPLDDALALIFAHTTQPPPSASARHRALPVGVDAVFRRALAKRPDERFATAGEMVAALTTALRPQPSAGLPPLPMPAFGPRVPTTTGGPPPSVRPGPTTPSPGRPWPSPGSGPRPYVAVPMPALPRRRRRVGVVLASIAGTLVLVLGGLAAIGFATQGSAPTTPDTTSPSTAAVFPPAGGPEPDAPVAHGRLLFAPSLDGTGRGFLDSPGIALDPQAGAIRHEVGALEMEAKTRGAFVFVQLDVARGFTTYVADLEMAVRPGTLARACWSLRWAESDKLAWYWCLNTTTGTAQFQRWDGSFTPLGDAVPVADLATGRLLQVTVVVEQQRLTMYLDGEQAATVTDTQVPATTSIPGLELTTDRGTGLVRITGLRYWTPADSDLSPTN